MTPERLAALHSASFTTPRPWTADEFRGLLTQKNIHLIPHTHGFALLSIAGPEAELLTIAVDPAQRRQGIARALMAKLETVCQSQNVEEVFLEVVENNAPACELYTRCGFVIKGARKDYYNGAKGAKVSAVVMAKIISPAQ
jgi:ribosomal-protein-alanine N-acetyltransferase